MSEASEPRPAEPPARTSLSFKIVLVLLLVIITFLFLPVFFMAGRAGVIEAVAFGWWSFLSRTLPGISWNWDIMGMSALCVLLVLTLAHLFLRWITKSIASARGRSWQWPWRWTWCGLIGVALLFLVGMSVGGAAHQIGWVIGSDEPWYERNGLRGGAINDMRQLEAAFQQALLESDGDVLKARSELADPDCQYLLRRAGEPPMIQGYHFLLIMDGTAKVAGTIIFPRDPNRRARSGGMYWFGDKRDYVKAEKLPELLQTHQKELVAL